MECLDHDDAAGRLGERASRGTNSARSANGRKPAVVSMTSPDRNDLLGLYVSEKSWLDLGRISMSCSQKKSTRHTAAKLERPTRQESSPQHIGHDVILSGDLISSMWFQANSRELTSEFRSGGTGTCSSLNDSVAHQPGAWLAQLHADRRPCRFPACAPPAPCLVSLSKVWEQESREHQH